MWRGAAAVDSASSPLKQESEDVKSLQLGTVAELSPRASTRGPSAKIKSRRIVHKGTIKKIDEKKGFGFVFCQELFNIYGSDVFVTPKQMSGFSLGASVSFAIKVDSQGRPQAVDLQQCEPLAESARPPAETEANVGEDDDDFLRITGTIKSYSAEHGYGFLTGKEALFRFGRDVFLHSKQISSFNVGDAVTFAVRITNGRPQAYSLKAASKALAWLAELDDEADGANGESRPVGERCSDEREVHTGEIKSYSSVHGYGFIGCAALHEQFGRDVFIHQSQFEGLHVGDRVTFRAQVKRGQPQACGVALAQVSASAPAQGHSATSSRVSGLSAEELARKLCRACASSRPDATGQMAELLAAGAEPNTRDAFGLTPLMISALNERHAERKCKLLIERRADLDLLCSESLTSIQWARERINPKFAAFLAGVQRGEATEYTVALEVPQDEF